MKQDQNPETPNVCNNCVKPEKKPVDEISILIKCDTATQKMIEEICINEGISFSEYFLGLHNGHWEIPKNSKAETHVVYPAPDLGFSKANLPEGFGKVNLPEDAKFTEPTTFVAPATIYPKSGEPIQTSVSADPPKKGGRPFKKH
jgi:hypothetical protein